MAAVGLAQRDQRRLAKRLGGIDARPAEARELRPRIRSQEIRENDGDGSMRRDAAEKLKRGVQIGATAFRLVKKNLADHAENVAASFARRHEFLDLIRKENEAHL